MADLVDAISQLTMMFGEQGWDESTLSVIYHKNDSSLQRAIDEVLAAGTVEQWNMQQLMAQRQAPASQPVPSHPQPSALTDADVSNPLATAAASK